MVITYCTGFCFESVAVVANNNYVDITFTAGTYNTNGGSGALEASDFSLTFSRNNGPATAASISSVKKNDNASEGSASALSGGETVVRMFLNITGSPAGVESIFQDHARQQTPHLDIAYQPTTESTFWRT